MEIARRLDALGRGPSLPLAAVRALVDTSAASWGSDQATPPAASDPRAILAGITPAAKSLGFTLVPQTCEAAPG